MFTRPPSPARRYGRAALLILMLGQSLTVIAQELNIYSARQEALIKPLLDAYSEQTGIAINLVTGKGDALLTRLQSEGRNSPADLLITTDAGRLYRAQQAGVLQQVSSPTLDQAIPAHLRSAEGYWYGLSVRARGIVYARDRVQPAELATYEALAEPQWRGRICVRSSSNIYNQSLVAGMLSTEGEAKTAAWLQGFVRNFARPPQGGDRDQIKAVAAGQCDIAVVNSYYLGGMIRSQDPRSKPRPPPWSTYSGRTNRAAAHMSMSLVPELPPLPATLPPLCNSLSSWPAIAANAGTARPMTNTRSGRMSLPVRC